MGVIFDIDTHEAVPHLVPAIIRMMAALAIPEKSSHLVTFINMIRGSTHVRRLTVSALTNTATSFSLSTVRILSIDQYSI